jgi:hypothetical protein
MAGQITRSTFHHGVLENLSIKTAVAAVDAQNPMVWQQHYRRMKPAGREDFVVLHNVEPTGYLGFTPEGGEPPRDAPDDDAARRIFAEKFGMIVESSGEWIEDNRVGDVLRVNKFLGYSTRETMAELASAAFNSGFTANSDATNVAANGLVYFTQTHTIGPSGVTFDTESSSTLGLTWQNVIDEIVAVQTGHTSGRGQQANFMADEVILLYGRNNAQAAYELFLPGQQPGTSSFNRNFLESFKIRHILSPHITGTNWFLLDRRRNPFVWVDKRGPTFSNDRVFTTDGGRNKVTFRAAWGAGHMRGSRGSVGA